MLALYMLAVLVGIGWGFISLHRILSPAFAILPLFREIRELTKMETSHLLYVLFGPPVIWTFLLVWSGVAVALFLPDLGGAFFFGVVVALVVILAEFGEEKRKLQARLMRALKEDLLSGLREPGSKYPPYSPVQMRMACWRPPGLIANDLQDVSFECAVCSRLRKISQVEVCFRGTRRRFVVRCDLCHEPSIIRITGSFLSKHKAVTEACIPQPKGRDKEKAGTLEPAGPNSAGPRS